MITAIALGIEQYLAWWKNPPHWLNLLPASLLFAACFLFAWAGTTWIFLQEGDQLFLFNQKHWLKKIMWYGLIYSFARDLLLSLFFVLLLAPFLLVHYQFLLIQLIVLFSLTFLTKILLGLAKQLLTLRFQGWRQFLAVRGILLVGSLLFITLVPSILNNLTMYVISILFFFIASGTLSVQRLNYRGSFYIDVAREQSERLKYVNFLLGFTGVNVKKPKKQRKSPWLFPHSNLIFKKRNAVNGLAELCIKVTLRNGRRLVEYMQFVFIYLLIILAIPGSLKGLIWLVLAFVFVNFVGLYWKECLASEFIQQFSWHSEDKHLALRKFLFIMTLPGFLLTGFIGAFQLISWLGAFFILPLGIALVFYICRIVAFYIKAN
jgi:ABC-2 type transport system permease protein